MEQNKSRQNKLAQGNRVGSYVIQLSFIQQQAHVQKSIGLVSTLGIRQQTKHSYSHL